MTKETIIMELVILIGILVVLIVVAKGGMAYLRKIKAETGYNPIGFLNTLLIIGFFVFGICACAWLTNGEELGFLALLGTIACIGLIIFRNRVLKSPGRIILVTFFQLFAPALTLLGIVYQKSGGIMGNPVMQSNLNGASYTSSNTSTKKESEPIYSAGQDALAREYGFRDAQDAANQGMDMKKYS